MTLPPNYTVEKLSKKILDFPAPINPLQAEWMWAVYAAIEAQQAQIKGLIKRVRALEKDEF